MTSPFLSKEQLQIITDFGSAMDKMNKLLQESQSLLEKVTEMTQEACTVLTTIDAREERMKTEAAEELNILRNKAREEISKLKKRIKTLENRNGYLEKKPGFETVALQNFDV